MADHLTKATELCPVVGRPDSVLADGTFIFGVSVQREWVYIKGLRPDGRFVRRRYRHDQMVKVRG